jgi:hypothetical protein
MSHIATSALLAGIRSGRAKTKRVFAARLTPTTTFWQGVADWPRPDNAFQDSSTGASLAIEFKPPGHDKGEYVRGLGQAMTYLDKFEMSALVLPKKANDGYEISSYLTNLLESKAVECLPVAVLEYQHNPSQLEPRRYCKKRIGAPPPIPERDKRVFWAYWRDISQYEIFDLLREIDRTEKAFDKAFDRLWIKKRSKGKALNWEGTKRKPSTSGAFQRSDRTNSRLAMHHIGLINSNGLLTNSGYELLYHGKIYGPESMSYLMNLGNLILTNGRHLELILWIEEKQRTIKACRKRVAKEFLMALDRELEEAGIIAKAPTGRAKATFIRDEPKLWNKLGLLERSSSGSYFFEREGYRFNWKTCIELINYK